MKITITREFKTVEEAIEWLAPTRVGAPAEVVILQAATDVISGKPAEAGGQAPSSAAALPAASTTTTTPPEPEKKVRKKRADAGQPRGAYKTTGEPAASEPAATAGISAPAAPAAAPATPTIPAAPPVRAAPPAAAPASVLATEAPAAAAAPTLDDARAALKRLNDVKGLGMAACMGHLQEFGVTRVSELKPEGFALFIAQADEKIAEAAAALAATAAKGKK